VSDPRLLGSPAVQRRLAALPDRPLNFDLTALGNASPSTGWAITNLCQPLPPEPPGAPVCGGSWEIARRLMRGYEFADPSIVRAYYDSDVPLERRNMLLELRALGVVHLFVGVRVGNVYDEIRRVDGHTVRVWGWNYRTLQGHVECGQMDWEVWKWPHDGRVEFRVHAVSRPARIGNPLVRVGFWLLRGRERRAFLMSTQRRMQTFTELGLERERGGDRLPRAAADLTARPGRSADPVHDALADTIRRP
jgi:uncharacterized protein (UPF0548 family)